MLVDTSGRRDIYLEEPHFHGDLIRGRILSYRIYGADLLTALAEHGFSVDDRQVREEGMGIYDVDVLVAEKPGRRQDTPASSSAGRLDPEPLKHLLGDPQVGGLTKAPVDCQP